MTQDNLIASELIDRVRGAALVAKSGRVTRVMPTFIEADGPHVPIGTVCDIQGIDGPPLQAEVVGIDLRRVVLMPFGPVHGVLVGAMAVARPGAATVRVGEGLLGRVVNATGEPIDDDGALALTTQRPLHGRQIRPLERLTRAEPLETGIKAIDALLTVGVGQRLGIFAGSGVGKTTLLHSIARSVQADVRILCLVGERGREAADLWNNTLSPELRKTSVQIVSTSDDPAVVRVRAVLYAAAIAEYFRDQGRHVVFLLDSLTRLAMALREVGLAAGEPPTVRAYTPSVFAVLPRVVERFGAVKGIGAITAFFSVLTEGDESDDPLAETVKALLDGHITLSRDLAEQGQYPAINVQRSVSRFFPFLASESHRALASDVVAQLAAYESSRSLIESGLHKPGVNQRLDRAISLRESVLRHLRQRPEEKVPMAEAIRMLQDVVGVPDNG